MKIVKRRDYDAQIIAPIGRMINVCLHFLKGYIGVRYVVLADRFMI